MTTGDKIFGYRKKAGFTQEELADRLGVSRQAVSKWEQDAAFPETDKVLELCKLFSVSGDELLFGRENASILSAHCLRGGGQGIREGLSLPHHGGGLSKLSRNSLSISRLPRVCVFWI